MDALCRSNGSKDGSKQPNARTKWLVEHEPSYNIEPSTQINIDQNCYGFAPRHKKWHLAYIGLAV
jgi:hypothetical protein